jgi:sigma-B regulation protein RsbU (phosphoserine phosphatase)
MKGQLSTRLIILVGIPATLLFAMVVWSASVRGFGRVVQQAEASSRATGALLCGADRWRSASCDEYPRDDAAEPRVAGVFGGRAARNYLRQVVAMNPEIYGSCIAFEPHGFSGEKLYYAPYFYQKDGAPEFVQLGNPEYDYFKWDWYRLPKESRRALWSEPYFDDGGGNAIMTTYSVPFTREGKFWGIATIDISMNQLITLTESIVAGKTGYAFIVSKQGRLLAYPEKERILRDTIEQLNPNSRGGCLRERTASCGPRIHCAGRRRGSHMCRSAKAGYRWRSCIPQAELMA